MIAAVEVGDVALAYRTESDYVGIVNATGLERSETVKANTLAVRFSLLGTSHDNRNVPEAIQMTVDTATLLELGTGGLGMIGENHYVWLLNPEYAELPPDKHDPAQGAKMIAGAGHEVAEFENISIGTEWQSETCDSIAAQMRDAGLNVKCMILPGSAFWNDWLKYPISATEWGPSSFGVSDYGAGLGTKGGVE